MVFVHLDCLRRKFRQEPYVGQYGQGFQSCCRLGKRCHHKRRVKCGDGDVLEAREAFVAVAQEPDYAKLRGLFAEDK